MAKVKPSNQVEALDSFHELIVSMRAEGISLRRIANAMNAKGISVDRYAIHRYCTKHNIAPDPRPEAVVTPNYESFPVVFDSKSSTTKVVSPPRTEVQPVPKPVEPLATTFVVGPTPAVTTTISVPVHASSEAGPEQAAAAELLAGLGPRYDRIQAAQAAGDLDEIQRLLNESVAWLERMEPKVHPVLRESLRTAVRQTMPFLAEVVEVKAKRAAAPTGSSPQPKPLFTPLPRAPVWHMDEPLVHFNGGADVWTLQDACEGTLILGATGSGKTSGSGQLLAKSFLQAHFGGIVLTAKEDESQLWQRYAEQTGRSGQLCVVRPGGSFKFNFLDYQARLKDEQGGSTENVVELFHSVLEANSKSQGKGTNESFWVNTSRQLFRNLVRVIRAAEVPLTLKTLRQFLVEVPSSQRDAATGDWKQTPTFGRLIAEARTRTRGKPETLSVDEAIRYWTNDFPALNAETRSIVATSFTSTLDLFFDPVVWDLFCGETTITPEAVLDGAIIVIDLPVKKFLTIGRVGQLIWKHFFQLAIERRSDPNDATRRPVFLWADEAQHFWSDHDGVFQATARSSRCASVFLTQNMPNFYAQAGGKLAKERLDGFAANLNTKLFHANGDPTTNRWASDQIGKSVQYRASVSKGNENPGIFHRLMGRSTSRTTASPSMEYEVPPADFGKLRTGAKRYGYEVDAILLKSGARFSSGKSWFKATFAQESD